MNKSAKKNDFIKTEVSCRVLIPLFQELEKKNQPQEILLKGIDYPVEHILNKHGHIDWDTFCTLMANAGQIWSDDELVEIGRMVVHSKVVKPFILIAKLLLSVKDLYCWLGQGNTGLGGQLITNLEYTYQESGPNKIILELKIPDNYRSCREFFITAKGALESAPRVLGLKNATIEVEMSGKTARYFIQYPKYISSLAWLRRLFYWPITARVAAQELLEAGEVLQKQYLELEKQISIRKSAEKELQNSWEQFSLVTKATNDAIYDWDLQRQTAWCNEGLFELIGEKNRQIHIQENNNWWFKNIHPDDRDEVITRLEQSLAGKENRWEKEYRLAHASGEYAYVNDRAFIIRDKAGLTIRVIGAITNITGRKLAEQTLRENLNFLNTLIDTIPNPIFYKDTNGVYKGCNIAFQEYLGLEKNQIVGKTNYDLASKELAEKYDQADAELLQQSGIQVFEAVIDRSDGTKREVIFNKATFMNARGKLAGIVGSILDITDRKRVENIQSVLYNIAQATNITKNLEELIQIIHKQLGRLMDATNFYVALYDKAKDLYNFPYWIDSFDKDYDPQFLKGSLTDYVRSTGKPLLADRKAFDVLKNAGKAKPVGPLPAIWMGAPLKIKNEIIGVVVIQNYQKRNIYTEDDLEILTFVSDNIAMAIKHKQAEDALRESQRFNQRITDATPNIIFVVDIIEKCIVYVSSRFTDILGYSGNQIEQMKSSFIEQLFERESARKFEEFLKQWITVKDDEIFERECRIRHADGSWRWFLTLSTAFMKTDDGQVKQIVGTAQDITDHKWEEAERQRLEAQIQHAQKLESLGVLAGGIAHDFNNHLTGILGNAGLALLSIPSPSPAKNAIGNIEKSALRAGELCKQMLAYSGKGKFLVQPLNLNNVVEEMGNLLEVAISKKVMLNYDFSPNLPSIEADSTQIRQVIMNLITNASDAIEDNPGVIAITTGVMHCNRDYLNSTYLREELPEGLYIYAEVADTGVGMDKETLKKIFDPFFSTKFTGRGLGLAAVLGIVRSHDGAIKIDSEIGKGTTFRVLFPYSDLDAEVLTPALEHFEHWQGNGTVLVVDDEEPIRAVCCKVLEKCGLKVLTASNGKEALDIYKDYKDEIRLVLLDMTMPHLNGEETYQKLRSIRNDINIVLSSGYNEQEATSCFSEKGLAGFLQKPYKPQDLILKIRQVLEPDFLT